MASLRLSLSLSLHANTTSPFKTRLVQLPEANLNSKPQLRGPKRAPKPSRESGPNLKFTYLTNNTAPPNTDADVDFPSPSAELSTEHCNAILKRLHDNANDDAKTLSFFDWMRKTGKLERNDAAYNTVIRLLSRREDWEAAEKLVLEMRADFGSELSFGVFNALIYACCKRNLVKLGAKWFRLMLDCGVTPNVATFGMLMKLYQKGWNLEEAEFAISHMRRFGIACESAYSSMTTIYSRFRLYEKAEGVIELMKDDAVSLNMENWLVILNVYSQQGKLEDAERVLETMEGLGFGLNVVAYNTMITGYGKASKMDAAQRLFMRIKESVELEPDETTYRSMIEGWGRVDNFEYAMRYYKELKRLGYRPNSSNLYTLIRLQAKYGDEEGAVLILDDMVECGCQYSSMIATLLHVYEMVGKVDKVPCLVKGSFYRHVLGNQSSSSTLVMTYVKHRLVEDAMQVLKDKKWKDPHYEDNLYHLLICSCKEAGLLEDAVMIYDRMPKSDAEPNMHIACTMIDIYSAMGLFKDAEMLYLKLKAAGVSLDMIAFSNVVRMYVKAGSLKDACTVLDEIDKRPDIVPDKFLLYEMLRIYQRCNMVEKLADLYYKISRQQANWDQELYNCVINCCAQALPVDELSRLFNDMVQRGFSPSTITFNVMLDIFGKAKLFSKVWKMYCMAKKLGRVDVISYNTIIDAYGKNKDFINMKSTVKKMQFDGFSVSLEAYNSMLDAYGKDGQMETFRSLLQRMKESNCAYNHYTYNTMINIYGEQGWIDEVANVLTELKEYGLKPDLCSYNSLIKAYGIAGMVEDAVGLIKEMRKNGIVPDKKTYTNLITALRRNDNFLEAVKWSLWLKQMEL